MSVQLYFIKKPHSDSTKKLSETDLINMLEFLIDSIFAMLGGQSSFVWLSTVLLFTPPCYFIDMRVTLISFSAI
jgi:hypothetical protein